MKRSRSSESQHLDTKTDSEAEQKVTDLASLKAPVSPPQRRALPATNPAWRKIIPRTQQDSSNTLATIEAGQVQVTDHLGVISERLKECIHPSGLQPAPRLPMHEWSGLYRRNNHPEGRHFVIHQHDHPIAGPHYDLRLQFSETSSVSWSIMYGLPGNPNSERLNRNATETRVHCLWNHLIETASDNTGSLIIWDTGEYEILPYRRENSLPETDDSQSHDSDIAVAPEEQVADSLKLHEAFKNRKIRIRLHGTRLPKNYTLLLRMDKKTDYIRPIRHGPKRRRRGAEPKRAPRAPSTSDSDSDSPPSPDQHLPRGSSTPHGTPASNTPNPDKTSHSDDDVDVTIQKNNAYPGSFNTIGSIHQRRWYLSLDRESSGFEPMEHFNNRKRKKWVRKSGRQGFLGFDPFYVRGPDVERSVVTGRLGSDVISDECVQGFRPRNGWRPVIN